MTCTLRRVPATKTPTSSDDDARAMERKRTSETVGSAITKRQKLAIPSPEAIRQELEEKKREIEEFKRKAQTNTSAILGAANNAAAAQNLQLAKQHELEEKNLALQNRLYAFNMRMPAPMPQLPEAKGGLGVVLHPSLASINKDEVVKPDNIRRGVLPSAPFATAKANQRVAALNNTTIIPSSMIIQPLQMEPPPPPPKPQLEILKPLIERDNPYFDTTLGMPVKPRKKSTLKFAKSGKFVKQAELKRAQQKVELLQARIAETVKKAGMEATLDLVTDKTVKKEAPPLVEWWDTPLLYNLQSYEDLELDTQQYIFDEPVPISDTSNEMLPPITSYILHPVPLSSAFNTGNVTPRPLMLTKKERKKLRRQRRMEAQREKQDKIRLGLLPPEQPKVRIANLMRVLKNEAVQDPTKIESEVRKQIEQRKLAHEQANQERALTVEQKKERRRFKQQEDLKKGCFAAVFKCKNINHPKLKFKLDANAQQCYLTGVAIVHRDSSLVVVEGGPAGIKAYKKLMLRRIKWDEVLSEKINSTNRNSNNSTSIPLSSSTTITTTTTSMAITTGDDSDGQSSEDEMNQSNSHNKRCWLIWEGQIKQPAFSGFRFRVCPLEKQVIETLFMHSVEHYWDLAKNWNADEIHA